jgi:hypothetical protein
LQRFEPSTLLATPPEIAFDEISELAAQISRAQYLTSPSRTMIAFG